MPEYRDEMPTDVFLLQDKSAAADRPAVKRVLEESQLESDVIDTSEDELFISIPMPQVTDITVFLLMISEISAYVDRLHLRKLIFH